MMWVIVFVLGAAGALWIVEGLLLIVMSIGMFIRDLFPDGD